MTPHEIKERRLALGLTVVELAEKIGVVPGAVRSWERGDRRPWPAHLRRLRGAFGFSEPGDICWCACHQSEPAPEQPRRGTPRAGTRYWTAEEDADLERLASEGLDLGAIADALATMHERQRTRSAISHRAHDLGLSLMHGYGTRDIERVLGVKKHTVHRWIMRGLLPTRRHAKLRTGLPTRFRRVERSDLETFVEAQAGILFDPSRVKDRALRGRAEVAAVRNRRTA